jgi:hypothetical protein
MDGIAIGVGWAFCSTLLMFPAEVCAEPDHARFIGGGLMMLAMMAVTVPLAFRIASAVSRPKGKTTAPSGRQPYLPLPPMPGPVRRHR